MTVQTWRCAAPGCSPTQTPTTSSQPSRTTSTSTLKVMCQQLLYLKNFRGPPGTSKGFLILTHKMTYNPQN